MNNKILIIGSTGKTGSRVYNLLKARKADLRSGSRSARPAFDWSDESTWPKVLEGISKVYITFQPDLAVPHALPVITNFVENCKKAGVRHLVLLSGRGEPEALACEQVVIRSGLSWTVVRASFFMQNFSEGFWAEGIQSGQFVIPKVIAKEPFVDADDIADVVAEVLTNDKHHGHIYELTGPELLSFADAISRLSAGLNQTIELVELPLETYKEMLKTHQVPDDVIWLISYLFTEVLDGRNETIKHDIEKVLKRKPGSFDTYIQKAMDQGLLTRKDKLVI